MQNENHQRQLKILWKHVDDPKVEELLRQVIALILNDPQELSPEDAFDNNPVARLNEGVLVENENQQIPNQ